MGVCREGAWTSQHSSWSCSQACAVARNDVAGGDDDEAIVRDTTSGKVVMRVPREGKLYVIEQRCDAREREEMKMATAYGARAKEVEEEAVVPENGVKSL